MKDPRYAFPVMLAAKQMKAVPNAKLVVQEHLVMFLVKIVKIA
jgi:hypothetical protein